jgi:hypothetical protein
MILYILLVMGIMLCLIIVVDNIITRHFKKTIPFRVWWEKHFIELVNNEDEGFD